MNHEFRKLENVTIRRIVELNQQQQIATVSGDDDDDDDDNQPPTITDEKKMNVDWLTCAEPQFYIK
ncbi:hypothetical protein DERF_003729 [Dermatophagoides farinae]|uniref:Uncharacterized protein n=1 Tax=Dermatophagoides farinae TaxID=6954 RepID=A0A922LAV6_DERFA|nr:hypothetical protein DERF_003729 [Dermatophagoides farinae]